MDLQSIMGVKLVFFLSSMKFGLAIHGLLLFCFAACMMYTIEAVDGIAHCRHDGIRPNDQIKAFCAAALFLACLLLTATSIWQQTLPSDFLTVKEYCNMNGIEATNEQIEEAVDIIKGKIKK